MRKTTGRIRKLFVSAFAGGSAFLLSGCDPTIQQTVEDGAITLANSFLASVLRAFVELGQEDPEATVRAILEPASRFFA